MIAKTYSAAVRGIEAYIVTVEADMLNGIPQFDIVGLPDSAVKESKERVKAALRNSGVNLGSQRITVNLAPSYIRKEGTLFDLPIAAAILGATGVLKQEVLSAYILAGELSLDGAINPVRGVLSIVYEAKKAGFLHCIVPEQNREEASLVEGIDIFPARTLAQVTAHLSGQKQIERLQATGKMVFSQGRAKQMLDFADVKGQEMVKRAFAIAAAGQHNLLIIGPPGVGKTMLAQRLPTIMPPLTFDESIEVTKIFSVKGLLEDKSALITERPFRATHHTLSQTALIGGGRPPVPGEVSLAHYGVLFLDEVAEYSRSTLEALRQPMEDKQVTISRISATVSYPSNFMLVAASNPCPCGYLGQPDKCRCSEGEISKYMGKLSGPMLDRIDMHVEAHPLDYGEISESKSNTSSAELREQVLAAMEIQQKRFAAEPPEQPIHFNAHMDAVHIEKYCVLGTAEAAMLEKAYQRLSLSMRAYHRILKLARTIADFEGSQEIKKQHLGEAIQYRNLDRKLWER